MGEALKAWALKQVAKAPVAPALRAWATFAQMAPQLVYLDQVTTATNLHWGASGGSESTGTTTFVIQDPYQ